MVTVTMYVTRTEYSTLKITQAYNTFHKIIQIILLVVYFVYNHKLNKMLKVVRTLSSKVDHQASYNIGCNLGDLTIFLYLQPPYHFYCNWRVSWPSFITYTTLCDINLGYKIKEGATALQRKILYYRNIVIIIIAYYCY